MSFHDVTCAFLGIEKYLDLCCRNCSKSKVINVFANMSQVKPATINTSNFVYPFLGSLADEFVNGYYFIPVMHVPEAYYITTSPKITLFHSIFHLYPLVTICLLMALLAGFICWCAETRRNTAEFPRDFPIGWFHGFWWAFVTMTTVGYGDKCPKTKIGRVFSLIWIFTGITVCGILTAMLTSQIMDANTQKVPTVSGSKVGVLKSRQYDALLVSHHGGLLYETEDQDFEIGVYMLIKKLLSKEIDGILLDKYSLWQAIGNLDKISNEEHRKRKNEIDFFMRDTIKTRVSYSYEMLAYGILVKHADDYEFLRDVIRGNRFNLHIELGLGWNTIKKKYFHDHPPNLFDADQAYFQTTAIILVAANLLIFVFGMLYEYLRRKSNLFKSFAEDRERRNLSGEA